MTHQSELDLAYRDELRIWVPALAGFRAENSVCDALAPGSTMAGLKLFAEGNLSKRREKLHAQLESVAEVFEDFEVDVSAYIRDVPSIAYDTTVSDGDRFLTWLERMREPTPRQQDYIACQRARLAVESAARANRRGHRDFQELWTFTRHANVLDSGSDFWVHLNPSRAWSQFKTTALLGDDEAALPADVLFFAAGETIATAVLEPEARMLVEELAANGPVTLEQWAALSRHPNPEELLEVCRDLTRMGVLALGLPVQLTAQAS